jgi:peptide-methionine (S)-S-oxide reductase
MEAELTQANGSAAETRTELATFGAGCFWQVEDAFRKLDGVVDTAVGYEGGTVDNPSYEDVCSGTTGHAEVAQITYDPEKISYEELLETFWSVHDPTQVNRQGPDFGTQYRTVIFFHSDDQQLAATESKARVQAKIGAPVATSIEPAGPFWRAEEYHQCYLENRSTVGGMLRSLIGH